ncbi:MAG: hypothetical protein A2700_03050 [Candidatus Blackburnbacteria bacterium RIFCSPHIGHO2_01_FULL_44_64]|uniref:Polymerase nucleotidyl transferase domain-containing protein n=2 Tax=Patescibacteria group TaxID=1783273 RepID=A0A0G1KF24_9BACT|nr:MAG: hypothetical protein UW78_C0002G0009 [Candidatus Azambacteria bacterium GW2011_GWA1_44_9]OGY08312.1 MAG: hypothetical protein A2700_03050 [Candidatus Blackburnbacteria bacterium RIFCSPHIGHO2_01_FULL_44_64]OGY10377.1 MAG: hypothetical protein A3D26_03645 [Candidatus Blackburnbacteria bacterium RIFCSPHIGHO2_02_FULL_44_20]OGY12112.1 MAG: hypothetical protein A3E16_00135 [Candidatus Blackburnbacteria bacterium RIFCSPHIGHO2_12_FULL_44_25]OGY13729.1 MAG: hypothetical protein A3A62_02860 [Cand
MSKLQKKVNGGDSKLETLISSYPGLLTYKGFLSDLYDFSTESSFVRGFWVHGSRITGFYHEFSDLDIAFVLDSDKSKGKIKNYLSGKIHYDPSFPEYFLDTLCEYWELNGIEVGVHIYTLKEVGAKLCSLNSSVEFFERTQAFVEHVFLESLFLVDKGMVLKKFKDKAYNYPEDIRTEIIELYKKRLEQKFVWWQKRPIWKSVFEEITDLKLIIDEISKLHYAINRRYYVYALKSYAKDLETLKPNIKDAVFSICTINPQSFEGKDKRKLIMQVFSKLMRYYDEYK